MFSPAFPAVCVEARRRFVVVLLAGAIACTGLVLQNTSTAHAAVARISASTLNTYAKTMLAMLNNERKAHGKRPLAMNWRLQLSAYRHNRHMAAVDVMSHQLPKEPFFGTRITNAGYRWRAAGENIGCNSDLSVSGLLALEKQMYNEKAPNDGHRLNILSTSFVQVGINVYYDAPHHKIWFTQDFGRPAG